VTASSRLALGLTRGTGHRDRDQRVASRTASGWALTRRLDHQMCQVPGTCSTAPRHRSDRSGSVSQEEPLKHALHRCSEGVSSTCTLHDATRIRAPDMDLPEENPTSILFLVRRPPRIRTSSATQPDSPGHWTCSLAGSAPSGSAGSRSRSLCTSVSRRVSSARAARA